MPRRLAVVALALPLLLAGCGADDDAATSARSTPASSTAPTSSTAPLPSSAAPTPADSPVQQWFHDGGRPALDALAASASSVDVTSTPVDSARLQGQCQQLLTDVEAAQALPPFPVPSVAEELTGSYPGLAAAGRRCLTEAAAGQVDAVRSGLLGALYSAVSTFQLAQADAISAIVSN